MQGSTHIGECDAKMGGLLLRGGLDAAAGASSTLATHLYAPPERGMEVQTPRTSCRTRQQPARALPGSRSGIQRA